MYIRLKSSRLTIKNKISFSKIFIFTLSSCYCEFFIFSSHSCRCYTGTRRSRTCRWSACRTTDSARRSASVSDSVTAQRRPASLISLPTAKYTQLYSFNKDQLISQTFKSFLHYFQKIVLIFQRVLPQLLSCIFIYVLHFPLMEEILIFLEKQQFCIS